MASLIENSTLVNTAMSMGAIQVPEELAQLVDFVEKLKPVNVMEIGAESGATFFLWCQLASGLKLSVDWPCGASGSWKYVDHLALQERTNTMLSWGDGICIVTGDSHSADVRSKVNAILKNLKLDFLFIDGDHSYEGVKADYRNYREFVKPGGFIAFHDIKDTPYHRRMSCEVGRLWKELMGEKQEFCSNTDWGGIGLMRV
jgi:cephalosporin hydroxylase